MSGWAQQHERARLHPERAPHGTPGGYSNWLCRCTACRAAWAKYMHDYKQRRIERVVKQAVAAEMPVCMEPPPLIRGLIAVLPPEGQRFPPRQLERWLAAAKISLDLIYGADDDE
jgi:hypothetical protein